MTARDVPRGEGTPCPHHSAVLTGWDSCYHTHESHTDRERRQRHYTGACCDHPRPSRDGQPTTEETL